MKKYFIIFFIFLGFSLSADNTALRKSKSITITFHGIKEVKGNIRFSIVSEKDKKIFPFPGKKKNGSFKQKVIASNKGKVTVKVNLEAGQKYAISAYHDLDGNSKFNLLLGCIPKEPYGFSILKNPPLGKPTFDECSFDPDENNKVDVYF